MSYLLPLIVYFVAGAGAITGVASSFIVKNYLDLSAATLATIGFWAGLPWALKVPAGQFVDRFYHLKEWVLLAGSALITGSFLIVLGILNKPELLTATAPLGTWFVISALLVQVGFMIQDVVADATTSEVVPTLDSNGAVRAELEVKADHSYLQTLGRVAIITGGFVASMFNLWLFGNAEGLSQPEKLHLYNLAYLTALTLPALTAGIGIGRLFGKKDSSRPDPEPVDKKTLIGALIYAGVSIGAGIFRVPHSEEISLLVGVSLIGWLAWHMSGRLDPQLKKTMWATAFLLFMFRATPSPGDGLSWWMMDVLQFDENFYSKLGVISTLSTIAGLYLLKKWVMGTSLSAAVVALTLGGFVLSAPMLLMYFANIHILLANATGGLIGAKSLMAVDTALASPLDQLAMIPMLAWIARSAPNGAKATYFALMASLSNLALQAGSLLTIWINQTWVVSKATKTVPADYSQLGSILIVCTVLSLAMPLLVILWYRIKGIKTA